MGWLGTTRRFQMWEYSVSHGQLLLRSTKGRGESSRVDVLFSSVEGVKLLTSVDLDEIAEQTESVAIEAGMWRRNSNENKYFRLRGPDGAGWIIAGTMTSHEDELEYHEPSGLPCWPMQSGQRPARESDADA